MRKYEQGNWGELFATGLYTLDYFYAISFQDHEVCNTIINSGSYTNKWRGKNKTADDFYRESLGYPEGLMYSFGAIGSSTTLGYPFTVRDFAMQWYSSVSFNMLFGRDLLELKIPKSECVIGDIAHPYTGVKLIDESNMRNHGVELVTRYIKKEWIISRYSPSSVKDKGFDCEGNEVEEIRTLYSPVFTTKESLFDLPMRMSGDGYAEKNYDSFRRNIRYEDSGMDLATWLSRADLALVQEYLNNVAIQFEQDPSRVKMGLFYRRLIEILQEDVYESDVYKLLGECTK